MSGVRFLRPATFHVFCFASVILADLGASSRLL